MDSQDVTTEAACAAIPFNWQSAFDNLECPLSDAFRMAEAAFFLAGISADTKVKNGFVTVSETEMRVLTFVVFETFEAIERAEKRWTALHNEACRLEQAAMNGAEGRF